MSDIIAELVYEICRVEAELSGRPTLTEEL
jgi:hypothetical protein